MIERVPSSVPLQIDAVWSTRFWTTTPPIYIPHRAWSLTVTVDADVDIRVAHVDFFPGGCAVRKYPRRPSPYQGPESAYPVPTLQPSEIQPSEAALNAPWSVLDLDPPRNPVTWTLIPVLKGSDGGIRSAIIAFTAQDTEGLRRGRWRIRESLRRFLPFQSRAFAEGSFSSAISRLTH